MKYEVKIKMSVQKFGLFVSFGGEQNLLTTI